MSWCTDTRQSTARKPHLCSWCAESIEPGEVYDFWTYGDPQPVRIKMHRECSNACSEYAIDSFDGEFDEHTRARGCSICERGDCEYPHDCQAKRPSQKKEEHPA